MNEIRICAEAQNCKYYREGYCCKLNHPLENGYAMVHHCGNCYLRPRKLNLGCGNDIRLDCINLDFKKWREGIDIAWDLEKTPLPFKDNEFNEIISLNNLEHITNFIPLVRELHRILKPSGKLSIVVPHYASFLTYLDPTHKRGFSLHTFDYFTSKTPMEFYFDFKFSSVKSRLLFAPKLWILESLVNIHPYLATLYEKTLVFIVPPSGVGIELIK